MLDYYEETLDFDFAFYDLELNNDILSKTETVRFYYSLRNDEKGEWRTPKMTMDEAYPYVYCQKALDSLLENFERVVWYPYVQNQVESCDNHGQIAQVNDIKILFYTMAGRCLFTIEKKKR